MNIFFWGDNNHVTKPRARHLGLKFLLMSSLEGKYGCVPPKTAPSYMYLEFFLSKLRAEYSESGCKKRQLLRNVCDLHLSPMVGCPLAKCNDHVDTWHEDDFRKIKAILRINNAQVRWVSVVESSWNNGIRNSAFKLPRILGRDAGYCTNEHRTFQPLKKKSLMCFFWEEGYSIVHKVSFF